MSNTGLPRKVDRSENDGLQRYQPSTSSVRKACRLLTEAPYLDHGSRTVSPENFQMFVSISFQNSQIKPFLAAEA